MVTIQVGKKKIQGARGSNLRETLLAAGVPLDSPCGGRGSCGKCKVRVSGEVDPPSIAERKLLGSGLKLGLRLACRVTIRGPLAVELPSQVEESAPSGEVISRDMQLGAAVDIGTTTLAGYLVDLASGSVVATASRLNPQASFGADVISRLSYAQEGGSQDLTEAVRRGVAELLVDLAGSLGQIRKLVLVGNSAMHHLWWGIETSSLAQAPYRPVSTQPIWEPASVLDLALHPGAQVYFLPLVAGFVGADTVAALLATGLDEGRDRRLLVDIGTNGEMVLATGGKLLTCAAAAGPALEGAEISCGMRGIQGAIEAVSLDIGIKYKVIGDVEPLGICGSGLVDLLSELLRVGAVDHTGRLLGQAEFLAQGGAAKLASNLLEDGFQVAVGPQGPIVLTSRDVRKLQLAKGAIRAGCEILLSVGGIDYQDLDEIILAGAFGSYLSPKSALRVGLLPPVEPERVKSAGNAAGEGAKLVLLSDQQKKRAEEIARQLEYIELAGRGDFQERFMEGMLFD